MGFFFNRKNIRQPAKSETDKKLKNMFLKEPKRKTNLSETDKLIEPSIYAPQLYKQLAAFGHSEGWITDQEQLPLMYPLLANAFDTALAVEWRWHGRVKDDDEAFRKGAIWCVYVAMADAYYCSKDWDDLAKVGLVYKIERTCGFDKVEGFVAHRFDIRNKVELREHLTQVEKLAEKSLESVEIPTLQKQECLAAMYYYGIQLAMQYMKMF